MSHFVFRFFADFFPVQRALASPIRWLFVFAILILAIPKTAMAAEADSEYTLLKTYTDYYRNGTDANLTSFSDWRDSAYPAATGFTFNGDLSYYRSLCNTVAVAAVVKQNEPGNGHIDWTRLRAILVAVMTEYDHNPFTLAKAGWGFAGDEVDPSSGHTTGLYWSSGLLGYPCTLAAALMWDTSGLTSTEKMVIRNALRSLAERIDTHRPLDLYYTDKQDNDCGDTWVEVASGDGSFLAAMSQFDRDYALATTWRLKAQQLMNWAYTHLNPQPFCPRPNNSISSYVDTVTNHNMYPNPTYALSVVNDTTRALLPWLAQGIRIQDNPSGIAQITSLSPDAATGNHKLYGGSITRPHEVYNANIRFVNQATAGSAPETPSTSGFSFFRNDDYGKTYQANHLNQIETFDSKSYLGRFGVTDWGFGVDFQNAAFAYPAFIDYTYYATPHQNGYTNYLHLLSYQMAHPYDAYFPPSNIAGCSGAQATAADWSDQFLAAACARSPAFLVQYFGASIASTIAQQINSHLFLNSFKAFNHVVAYLVMKSVSGSAQWPKNGTVSTLPNFNRVTTPFVLYVPSVSNREGTTVETGLAP